VRQGEFRHCGVRSAWLRTDRLLGEDRIVRDDRRAEGAASVVAPETLRPYTVGHVEVEVAVAIVVEPRCARPNSNARETRRIVGDIAQCRQGHVGKNGLRSAGVSGQGGLAGK
jgi:hypothetical protein